MGRWKFPAKQVRIMEAEFRKNVKSVRKKDSEEKAKLKEKANMKLLQNLDVCLEHMGCGPFEEVVIDVLLDLSMLQR